MTKAARILIVEDDPVIQETLSEQLRPLCKAIQSAHSAPEAQPLLSGSELVLCDQHLDGRGSGLDLYRMCRAEFPNTAFLLMSALPDEVFEQLTKEGIACPPFLLKPFSRQQLIESIRTALG